MKLIFSALLVAITSLSFLFAVYSEQTKPSENEWHFAVSGDSRNCGDVVMPAIAASAEKDNAQFYWHLGDYRAIYDFDMDMMSTSSKPANILDYETRAWDDFIQNQITPFKIPVFLAMGNHETISPKSREQYLIQFADWLDAPVIKDQRLADNPRDHRLKTYYHWVKDGVDFVSLDNASYDQFDNGQVSWAESLFRRDAENPNIKTVVLGMHAALPDSISAGHSMNESPTGTESGRRIYSDLLNLQKSGKRIYVLASHSHFYMNGIYNTEYWRTHGGVLPGWIIGTAGAVRYPLPPGKDQAKEAKTNVYGYLLATVNPRGEPAGTIRFDFHEFKESDIPASVAVRVTGATVHQCFVDNSQVQ